MSVRDAYMGLVFSLRALSDIFIPIVGLATIGFPYRRNLRGVMFTFSGKMKYLMVYIILIDIKD